MPLETDNIADFDKAAKKRRVQGFPQAQLPPELQDGNPLGIGRLRDGKPE